MSVWTRTIVAAWIKALTGVGPSMASGSQTYRGSCADLPQAPVKSKRQATVKVPKTPQPSCDHGAALAKSDVKSSVPKVLKSKNMPSMKPKSPMRLTMKAFLPASDADFFKK